MEKKRQYEVPGIGGQRGYVSFGKESAKGRKEGDLKEFWHFGHDHQLLQASYPLNLQI